MFAILVHQVVFVGGPCKDGLLSCVANEYANAQILKHTDSAESAMATLVVREAYVPLDVLQGKSDKATATASELGAPTAHVSTHVLTGHAALRATRSLARYAFYCFDGDQVLLRCLDVFNACCSCFPPFKGIRV